MSRIEAEAATFRSAMRNFRSSAVQLIYHFSDPSLPFTSLRPLLDNLDEELADFLTQETDNARIAAMNHCLESYIRNKDVSACVTHVRELISDKIKSYADNVLKREVNLEGGKKSDYDKYKGMIETTCNHLTDFAQSDPPDFAVAVRSIAALLNANDLDWNDIDFVGFLFMTTCVFATAWKTLSEFETPPQLTPDQLEILKLKKKIETLEQIIKEKDAKISTLNSDKMALKSELIQVKRRADDQDSQILQFEKNFRVMRAKIDNLPIMKGALEDIAKILSTPKKPDGE